MKNMLTVFVFSLLILSTLSSSSSSSSFSSQQAEPPSVCIIGSGIAGSSVAHFLRQYSPFDHHPLIGRIQIFERHGVVGGRMSTVSVAGETFEAGASILHPKNYHALNFAKSLNLTIREPSLSSSFSLGIWDGHKFTFKTLSSNSKSPFLQKIVSLTNSFLMFFRYGFSLFRMGNFVESAVDSFLKYYESFESRPVFETVDEMLKWAGLHNLTIRTLQEELVDAGLSPLLIQELVTVITRINYGQSVSISGLAGAVSLAGSGGGLWSIEGGNWQMAAGLINSSHVALHLHEDENTLIQRIYMYYVEQTLHFSSQHRPTQRLSIHLPIPLFQLRSHHSFESLLFRERKRDMGLKGFVEGGIASIVAGASTHPLDLIKVRMQLQGEAVAPNPALQGFRPAFALSGVSTSIAIPAPPPPPRVGLVSVGVRIVQSEGVTALLSGVSATVLRQTLYSTTRMGLYEILKEKWTDPSSGNLPLTRKIVAGLIAGGVGAAVGNPADVAMVRMQADGRLPVDQRRNYKSVLDAISQMSRQEGVTSLWRGSTLTVNRAMIVTASQLASYDQIKELILEKGVMGDGIGTHVTASFAAGFVAAVASNPIDVIKTRVMNMKVEAGAAPPYAGALDCAMKTVRAEGPMALYKGFIPTISRQGPFTVVLFVTLEQIRKLLKDF